MLCILVVYPEDAGGSHLRLEPEFARPEVRIRIQARLSSKAYRWDEPRGAIKQLLTDWLHFNGCLALSANG
jgi:hypothetical protein